MSLATFKGLCMDATDAATSGSFWAEVLGLSLTVQENGDAVLVGPTDGHRVWINQVPEPKTVKHRIHFDVYGTSVDQFVELGASVIDDDSFRWVVMADPEGGEFCLFVRDDPPAYRLYEVGIDCGDHLAQSTWWASVLGGQQDRDDQKGFSWVVDIPNAPFESVDFAPVPEPKQVKNRLHLDLVAPSIEPLLEAGATLLRARDDEINWDVLADPEGNEFCVFAPS